MRETPTWWASFAMVQGCAEAFMEQRERFADHGVACPGEPSILLIPHHPPGGRTAIRPL